MNEDASPIELLLKRAEDYVITSLALLQLHSIAKLADLASTLMSRLIVFSLLALSLLIMSLGAALWIGQLMGAAFYGFLVIGFLYCLLAIILFLLKDIWIKKALNNAIIVRLLKNKIA